MYHWVQAIQAVRNRKNNWNFANPVNDSSNLEQTHSTETVTHKK